MQQYQENRFRQKVDKALTQVKKILKTTRHPTFAEKVQHGYSDKFGLAEFLTNLSLAAQLNCLELIGLDESKLKHLQKWAADGENITLRFESSERCMFLRESVRKEDSKTSYVSENSIFGKSESKVVTTIKEWFWRFYVDWEIVAYKGVNPKANDSRVTLIQRKSLASCEIMSGTKTQPKPRHKNNNPIEVNFTWFVKQVDVELKLGFKINREKDTCRTPRRNEEIELGMKEAVNLGKWMANLSRFFLTEMFPQLRPTSVKGEDRGRGHGLDLTSINRAVDGLFVPVMPLFEEKKEDDEEMQELADIGPVRMATTAAALGLNIGDIHSFLAEQRRSIRENMEKLESAFPAAAEGGKLISIAEVAVCVGSMATHIVLQQWWDCVQYIEEMLKSQLISAIGKEVTAADFNEYMIHHNKKLYSKDFQPNPFCFAVRRPDHYPEGILSIEVKSTKTNEPDDPVPTICRRLAEPVTPMRFRLDAATNVEFTGERYLHAYVSHQFAGQSESKMHLSARARQFSSFIMMIGRIGGVDTFEPKHAIIVKDKDDLNIPLMLETLPSAKEFKDSIESLSPEQQRFAKAYRSMQLEGSVFGVLIVQLKPQLEKLLNLPNDSLTKEIKLTQQLLDLFIQYQIPSDLMSYDGPSSATQKAKLDKVKDHVKAIFDMINAAKRGEVASAQQKYNYNHRQPNRSQYAPRPGRGQPAPTSSGHGVPQSSMVNFSQDLMSSMMGGGVLYSAPRMSRRSAGSSRMTSRASGSRGGGGGMDLGLMALSQQHEMRRQIDDAAPSVPISEPVSKPVNPKQDDIENSRDPKDWQNDDFDLVPSQAMDFTKIPGKLDKKFLELDQDGELRSTKIKVGQNWKRRSQKALLADPVEAVVDAKQQKLEKQKAYDLIDALSRSGDLSIECATLHVVVAATHCFTDSLMNTLIVKNVNPIEKVERSSLIIATTIHEKEAVEMISADQTKRVTEFSAPALMPALGGN